MVTTSCCWIVGGRVHGYSSIRCDMSDKHCDRASSWITVAPSKVSRMGYIFFDNILTLFVLLLQVGLFCTEEWNLHA